MKLIEHQILIRVFDTWQGTYQLLLNEGLTPLEDGCYIKLTDDIDVVFRLK